MAMDLPDPAVSLLEERYGATPWAMLHAWVSDETILAVLAVAPEDAFDVEADTFDVDRISLEHVQLVFDQGEGWTLAVDGEVGLNAVFEELVSAHEQPGGEGADGGAPLES